MEPEHTVEEDEEEGQEDKPQDAKRQRIAAKSTYHLPKSFLLDTVVGIFYDDLDQQVQNALANCLASMLLSADSFMEKPTFMAKKEAMSQDLETSVAKAMKETYKGKIHKHLPSLVNKLLPELCLVELAKKLSDQYNLEATNEDLVLGLKRAVEGASLGSRSNTSAMKEPLLDCLKTALLYIPLKDRKQINVRVLVDQVLEALGYTHPLSTQKKTDTSLLLPEGIAEHAFQMEYTKYDGEEAFLAHLKAQMNGYKKEAKRRYPYFCIIQSSGYGKSRLMDQFCRNTYHQHSFSFMYLSFAGEVAYPKSNVVIDPKLKHENREGIEAAFQNLFKQALGGNDEFHLTNKSVESTAGPQSHQSVDSKQIFIIDEASQLLLNFDENQVDFFRSFRRAAKNFVGVQTNYFFVLLSTFSSVHQIMPAHHLDRSFKRVNVLSQDDEFYYQAMAAFLLHDAIGLRNSRQNILELEVSNCHKNETLITMGRPLWQAYHESGNGKMNAHRLVHFALDKLLAQHPSPLHHELSNKQMTALLACRACLSISPTSLMASALVASHMATAVKISDLGDEVIVEYPSEPILALASRFYFTDPDLNTMLRHAFLELKSYFVSGAVAKGHRGEVIVRLLNLIAIDSCMSDAGCLAEDGRNLVAEVPLGTFLQKFDRENANLSCCLGISNAQSNKREDKEYPLNLLENGRVCFTHFTYISTDHEDPMITPELLQYAYRRTAAIVVEERRPGIDWVIPVRLENNEGKEDFVGLVGQDKNRWRDTLQALMKPSKDETHEKVDTSYFLTQSERNRFVQKEWSLEWPSILFSIGAETAGAALVIADPEANKKRIPCIVLTSLGYKGLMDEQANQALVELAEFVSNSPYLYKTNVPITFGG